MKNIFIIFLFHCLFFQASLATAQEFSIGPKIGISQGNIRVNGNDFSSGNEKLGYHLGLFARLGGSRIFIQPEVLYTNTGGEFESQQGSTNITYSASFDRLDVPIMGGFKIAEFFRIQAGPMITFLLDSDFTSDTQNNIDPEYSKSSLGYQAGIGFDIANMIIDLKYEGFINRQSTSLAGLPTDQRQNQLMLSLGIRLF